MKPRDYETAWQRLKDHMLAEYVKTHKETKRVIKPNNQYHLFQVANAMVAKDEFRKLLTHMDNLDGTHEFSNLKHDLERGSE
ncbi:hypothetical protein [Staphylococcus debuckii]|uniref:hypothetical protein n=1 Tax=Staphylococcus debuckii TaxID=2044912 RepID=UPI000F4302F6|nr:hypothetical protein [Staphylococcus debuckii]AYU54663.1 hypothetical protein CNQ82_04165 [Staphylococcus debuckii]